MAKKGSGGIVFSTSGNSFEPDEEASAPTPASEQDLRVHLDRLKGNKLVTRVSGFEGPTNDLKDLGRFLKNKCGVGGNNKNGEILIQGDHCNRVLALLKEKGYKAKRSGG